MHVVLAVLFVTITVFQARDLELYAKVINLAHQKYNRIKTLIARYNLCYHT